MINLQDLIENPPLIHEESSGQLTSWQLSDEVLNFIDENISKDSITLETGTGISTILFAIKSSHHTCINPNKKQVERIINYCKKHNINTDKIDFKLDVSEKVLPSLNIDHLDLILIDGSHAFPIPFIDWYYTYEKLKLGGKMIIDDTQLWTGWVLKKFLIFEPEWKFKKNSPPRSAIFTKVQKYENAKWYGQQPYIVKNSHLIILAAKFKRFLRLLGDRKFGQLSKLIGSQLHLF